MDGFEGIASVDVLAELRALRQRVAVLEAQGLEGQRLEAPDRVEASAERSATRRGMLRLAGAAVVGGAAASLLGAQPAAATTGAMEFGAANDADADATTLTSTSPITLTVSNTSPFGTAVLAKASGIGTALQGIMDSPDPIGWAVWGEVNDPSVGVALVGTGGAAQLYLSPYSSFGTPADVEHFEGEVVTNVSGIFYCVGDGTPGIWRKIAGFDTAGAFHAITPTRVYDSRVGSPGPSGPLLGLATFNTRTISVADGRNANGVVTSPNLVPAGATAVAANVTVTGTQGVGYLAINPGGVTAVTASTINWFGSNQDLANGVILTLNSNRELTVVCGDGGVATHFIVDISGYYL